MAYNYWIAAGSNDFTAAANWSGVAPANGDDLMFDGRSSDSVTTNADANTLDSYLTFTVQEGYSGNIGSAGEYLEAQTDRLTFRGSGTLYWKSGTDGAGDHTDHVVINTQSGRAFLGCNTTSMILVELLRGNVTMDSTITGLTDLYIGDATVTIEGAFTYPDVYVFGSGNVTCIPDVTNLYHFGSGTWTQLSGSEAITTMFIGPNATMVYNGANNITKATVYDGGVLDLSRMGTALTIADLWRGRRATVKKSDSVIITNEHFL